MGASEIRKWEVTMMVALLPRRAPIFVERQPIPHTQSMIRSRGTVSHLWRLLVLLQALLLATSFALLPRRAPSSSATRTRAATDDDDPISVRAPSFAELTLVADVIMDSFYPNTTQPWRQLYKMGELNRLQQGFPYADVSEHRMLVACCRDRIVGFCDIDARKPNRPTSFQYNPRPYLSDLCIHPDYRRRGIARALISECEECCAEVFDKEEIFIRVERKNEAAVLMYEGMDYDEIDNDLDPSEEIVLLRKNLNLAEPLAATGGMEDEYSS